MTAFKDFSANFAQSVCLLTSQEESGDKTCTISSYSSVSSSPEADLFSFSLSSNSYMARLVGNTAKVRVCLLSAHQSSVANYFVKNRTSNAEYDLDSIISASIGFAQGTITSRTHVGESTLYIAKVQKIELLNTDLMPLVYRLRHYESS